MEVLFYQSLVTFILKNTGRRLKDMSSLPNVKGHPAEWSPRIV